MMILLFALVLSSAAMADSLPNVMAKKAFQSKVMGLYNKALTCTPLEYDSKTLLNVTDWLKLEPEIPNWTKLAVLLSTAKKAQVYASSKKGSDKVIHCFAGCFISQKLGNTSAVMVGWLKELQDSSDCLESTHFEEADYLATQAGSLIGSTNKTCESFCQRSDVLNLDGDEMLELARREVP